MSETNEPNSINEKTKKPAGPRRRQTHNAVERRRKDKINGWISKIAELLPCKEIYKQSKISTLEQTVDYIKLLVSEKEKLLSDKCSEVQAEEVKQLKKKLKYVSEQNIVYEKLLVEANISLNSLSEKVLKYSDKFERKNGHFVLKNSISCTGSQTDKAIQVNIPLPCSTSLSNSAYKNSSKKSKTIPKVKGAFKTTLKPKILNSTTSVLSNVPVNAARNKVSTSTACSSIQLNNNSCKENLHNQQDIILPSASCMDSIKNTSDQAGGVTTALSQFPVMSTTQGSSLMSVCNKNMSTIIIPTGGSILQQFPPVEKSSNAISIICPTTLPILLPQVINMSSVARNVGLTSFICPASVDNPCLQAEKSSLNNTLLTINQSSVVPISSDISTNARIVLPAQPTVLGNSCATSGLQQNIITPFVNPLPSNNPVIVPLQHTATMASSSEAPDKCVHSSSKPNVQTNNSNENNCHVQVDCQSVEKVFISKENLNEDIISNAASISKVNSSTNQSSIDVIKSKSVRNATSNAVPSLQVLSANKIISLANQSQKLQTNFTLSLHKKTPKASSISLQSSNVKNQLPNEFCVQIDSPVSSNYASSPKQPIVDIHRQNVSAISSSTNNVTTSDSTSKSKFSLSALMGDSTSRNGDCDSLQSGEQHKSDQHTILTNANSIWPPTVTIGNSPATLKTPSLTQFSDTALITEAGRINKINNVNTSRDDSAVTPSCGNVTIVDKTKHCNSFSISQCKDIQEQNRNENSSNTPIIPIENSMLNSSQKVIETSSNIIQNIPLNDNLSVSIGARADSLSHGNINLEPQQIHSKENFDEVNSSLTIQVPHVFSENISFIVNDCSMNQNILPSVFSMNQMVTLNSAMFVNSSIQGNILSCSSTSQGTPVSNPLVSAVTSTSSSVNTAKLPNFSIINKDNLLHVTATLTSSDEAPGKSTSLSNQISPASTDGDAITTSNPADVVTSNKNFSENVRNEKSKQISNCKKKKMSPKSSKQNMSDRSTCNSVSQTISSFDSSKTHVEKSNSFSKDDSSCIRIESNNYFSNCDILARATESIFGSEVLETNCVSKRGNVYFHSETSDTSIPVTMNSKVDDILQCSSPEVNHATSNSSNINPDSNKAVSENNDVPSSNLMNTINVETEIQNDHDLGEKQSKMNRIRKSKQSIDDEPPLKKIKESTNISVKLSGVEAFNDCHQLLDSSLKQSSEKQTASEPSESEVSHSAVNSVSQFENQIHIPENNCKTPTSVDNIFSLTPILGDMLKDVSHNIALESRNNFLSCNETQSLFHADKNYHSINFSTSSTEEYLNLPRMNFHSSSESSTLPSVQATNVSFAHTSSLCATQSDNSKSTDTLSLSEPQIKSDNKKKSSLCNPGQNHNLSVLTLSKSSECSVKLSHSESQYSSSTKTSNTPTHLFDTQASGVQSSNITTTENPNPNVSQAENQFPVRENAYESVSHSTSFYTSMPNTSSIQNFVANSSSMLHHTNFNCNPNNLVSLPFPKQIANTCNSIPYSSQSRVDSLNHSLSSLLKENSNTNVLCENRNGINCHISQSSSTPSNISQSKYSALSLISDQPSYSESASSSTNHSEYIPSSITCTPPASSTQFTSSSTTCSRNQRASLSYSAESLLQTSCVSSDKNKNKTISNRYPQRLMDKKSERNNVSSIHSVNDTPMFLPVSNCDINIQNAHLVPLTSVASFHNFSSSYNPCETVSTSIFNGMNRTHDVTLTLPNDNFLNMNLTADPPQILTNRHETSSTIPKHHSNLSLPFENHTPLYNNCNFLPHVKPTLDNSRVSESGPCFQPVSFSNNYTQPSQKTNCNFSHRTVPTNTDINSDISIPVGPPVPPFHADKNNFHRPTMQPSFSQNNTNFVNNLFYSSTSNNRDVNDMTAKPSNNRPSQEVFVPEGRQNVHDHNASTLFSNRKTVVSNRSKSKKSKTGNVNDSSITLISNMNSFIGTQNTICNKSNISCIPNDYFKSNSRTSIPPSNQLPCSQQKMPESSTNAIPTNPPFNSVLHQQSDNFFNLNFQHPNFSMSQLPRPPTQPLSCSCLTTPIISHTYSPSTHPVPNFNVSNLLPDMSCSNNQVSLSPVKFPPINHSVQSSAPPCQTNSTITNSAHIISHQSCTPTLYPSHPPMVRSSLNPILGHNPQSFSESQVPLVGAGSTPIMPQNTTFSATQNPPFRNVIHSLQFPRTDR